jgi:hypothetical protein
MNRTDRYHAWAVSVLGALDGPPLVCEPVITESDIYTLRRIVPEDRGLKWN